MYRRALMGLLLIMTFASVAQAADRRQTALTERFPPTAEGRNRFIQRVENLYAAATMATLCDFRSAGWGTVLRQAVRDAVSDASRDLGDDWNSVQRRQGRLAELDQMEHVYLQSWKMTPQDDCAEARDNYVAELKEGDAIVRSLRPNGVDPWEGLARAR